MTGMKVRKKRPRGFKKRLRGSSEPPELPICCSMFSTAARVVGPDGRAEQLTKWNIRPLNGSPAARGQSERGVCYAHNPHLSLCCTMGGTGCNTNLNGSPAARGQSERLFCGASPPGRNRSSQPGGSSA
jgi:hypothetical protein